MSLMEGFRARLVLAREIRGFSQREVDRRAGFSLAHTSKIETGGRNKGVDAETVVRFALALDVTLDWLLLGNGYGPGHVPQRFPRELQQVLNARQNISSHTLATLHQWFDDRAMQDRTAERWATLIDALEEEARTKAAGTLSELARSERHNVRVEASKKVSRSVKKSDRKSPNT